MDCDHDQRANQSLFVKRAQRIRNVPRLIGDSRLEKRGVPVVQVKDWIPVIVTIEVSRQEDIDSSLGIKKVARPKRIISVEISRGMPPIDNSKLPIAALAHGFSSA